MKSIISTIIKLYCYNKVIKLINEIQEYTIDKDSVQMLDFYESIYQSKIVFLLRDKYKNL